MIKEIRITKLEDLMPLLADQEYQPGIGRSRSSYIYRGMYKSSFKMQTTLQRNCKHLQSELEPSILESYAKYALLSEPNLKSIWHIMISGQHHGLPTRLLDWTHSSLIALQFAVAGGKLEKMDEDDCVVWRLDIPELFELLPEKYKNVLTESTTKIFTIGKLQQVCGSIQQYDEDMGDKSMVILEPSSIDQRVVNQYSFFSMIPAGIEDLEDYLDKNTNNTIKYVIDRNLKWRICDMLDSLNVSERIIYPGLDGLSDWIARHYYVR